MNHPVRINLEVKTGRAPFKHDVERAFPVWAKSLELKCVVVVSKQKALGIQLIDHRFGVVDKPTLTIQTYGAVLAGDRPNRDQLRVKRAMKRDAVFCSVFDFLPSPMG